ncbi:MAG TPA: alpha/beta hydrolase [Devosia sp.]
MNFVTSKDGTRIAYTATGKGPAIILVNGATAFPALDPTLPALTEMLKDDFTLVAFDRRGRGQSGDTRPFSPQREIEDIEALIDQFGGKATLYGQSSGAVLSLIAAGKLPGVTHVLAYEPPYSTPGTGNDLPADYVEKLARYNAENNGDTAAALFLTGAVGLPEEAVDGMRQGDFWPVMVGVGPTIYYDAVYMTLERDGYEIPSHLWAGSQAKFLIVDGGASFPGMREAADAVAAATPGAGRKSLGDQGHGPSAEAIAPVLREFAGR